MTPYLYTISEMWFDSIEAYDRCIRSTEFMAAREDESGGDEQDPEGDDEGAE